MFKTHAASFLNGFKNDPFHKVQWRNYFVDQHCLSRKNHGEISNKIYHI